VYHVQVVVFIINKHNFVNVQLINFGMVYHVSNVIILNILIRIWRNVYHVHLVWFMIYIKVYVLIVQVINHILMVKNVQIANCLLIIINNYVHVLVVHILVYIIHKLNNANVQLINSLLDFHVLNVIILNILI
jgi:hypothetical protein